jgi:hypothetical protein
MTQRWFCEGKPCPTTATSENYSWTYAGTTGQPEYLKTVLPGYAAEGTSVIEPFKPTYMQNGKVMISYLDPGAMNPDLAAIQKIKEAWLPDGHGFAKGDIVWAYLWPHMMIVVGWGPMLITWEEINAFWEANKDPEDGSYDYSVLTTTYPEPNYIFKGNPHPELGYVPYLVDHGLHGVVEEGSNGIPALICPACVQPRPYYALYWSREVTGIHDTYVLMPLEPDNNAPQFIHIPDSLIVPVEEVKVSPTELGRVTPTPTSNP